jgi:hypothetical protein
MCRKRKSLKYKLLQLLGKLNGVASKIIMELPYDPKKMKSVCGGGVHSMVSRILFTKGSKLSEAKFLSTGECKKTWYIYTMEYYSVTKENAILSFTTTGMALKCIMLSERVRH